MLLPAQDLFPNFILWSEAGYFDNAADTKPLLHLWSLGIEEQFYIVWPLLLGVAWRYTHAVFPLTLLRGDNLVCLECVRCPQ